MADTGATSAVSVQPSTEQTGSANATPVPTNIVTVETAGRGDVSAVTVARMMGLATLGEVKLIENKVELLITKLSLVQAKIDKISSAMQSVPTGADFERIDVHVGSIKAMLKEALGPPKAADAETGAVKKPSEKIVTN